MRRSSFLMHSFLRGVARLMDLGGRLEPHRVAPESRVAASDWLAVEEDIRQASSQVSAKERVLSMAHELARQRRTQETRDVFRGLAVELVGLVAGAALCAALSYVFWVLARRGDHLPAIAALTAAVSIPVSAFAYEHRRQSRRCPHPDLPPPPHSWSSTALPEDPT